VWYQHSRIQQGYTQRGQIIGAAVGPSGTRETVAVDWLGPRIRLGWAMQRQRVDVQRIATLDLPLHPWDTQVMGGPLLGLETGRCRWDARYVFQYEFDRYSVAGNDARNHRLELRAQLRVR
jgi:hypothetical protein